MMREPLFSLLPAPAPVPLAGKRLLVLGLGDTGLSVARLAARQGAVVRVADTRTHPPCRTAFGGEFHGGPFDVSLLDGVELVCISPGLSLESHLVGEALARGIPVLGDVELFAWHNRAPGVRSATRSIWCILSCCTCYQAQRSADCCLSS